MVEQLPPHVGGYRNYRRGARANRPNLGRRAVAYARKSVPVFPCKPGEKTPAYERRTLEHGHKDATTDEEQIRRWWSKWPDANVAMPTGKRSGIISLDIDTYKPGAWTPEDVARELGPLPDTLVIETGRGGLQYWFAHPEGEELPGIPEDVLGPGVCVKAAGGYVLCPPSATEGPYEVLEKRPLAVAPEWLVEALRKPSRGADGERKAGTMDRSATAPRTTPTGGKIPEGQRDNTMISIAGRLHDGTRNLDQLTADLMAINEEQFDPPLPAEQVRKKAESAYRYPPCKKAAPEVTPEVLSALDAVEAEMWRQIESGRNEWSKRSGKTNLSLTSVLLELAREHSRMLPSGAVAVVASYRQLAERCRVGRKTVERYAERIKTTELVRQDLHDRSGTDAGAWVLVPPARTDDTRPTAGLSKGPGVTSVVSSRAPALRWSAPDVQRYGKSREAVVRCLLRSGEMPYTDLTAALGSTRTRDLRRRVLPEMEAAGVVELLPETLRLAADWEPALERVLERERERERSLYGKDSDTLQREKHQREQEAYRNRDKQPAESHPANAGADGWAGELEKLPDLPDLTGRINARVGTTRGPGVLWDVKGGEARVVLDADPSKWVPFDPSELVLQETAA